MTTEVRPAAPDAAPAAAQLARRIPVAFALLVVLTQISYPLLHGHARDVGTVVIVVLFAVTCSVQAVVSRGVRFAAALLVVTAGGGFAVELLGVHTGFPFGSYAYNGGLGPRWGGVPPVIGLAWTMLAWPAAVAARALVRGRASRVLLGAWALATADLFLDPQMVRARYWTWRDPNPHLPGVVTVPLMNYAGWLLAALAVSAAVQWLVDRDVWRDVRRDARSADADTNQAGVGVHQADDRVPLALYLWLYVGWVVAQGVFLDLRTAAVWGALGMGTVAVPLAVGTLRRYR